MLTDIHSDKNLCTLNISKEKILGEKVMKNVILSADNITNFMGNKKIYNHTINFALLHNAVSIADSRKVCNLLTCYSYLLRELL